MTVFDSTGLASAVMDIVSVDVSSVSGGWVNSPRRVGIDDTDRQSARGTNDRTVSSEGADVAALTTTKTTPLSRRPTNP